MMITPHITSLPQAPTARVWLVRTPGVTAWDLSATSRHGELMQPIFGPRVSPFDVKRQCEVIRTQVLPFASRDDFVLTVGPQVMVSTLAALWMIEFGVVRYLLWDRHACEYVARVVEVGR